MFDYVYHVWCHVMFAPTISIAEILILNNISIILLMKIIYPQSECYIHVLYSVQSEGIKNTITCEYGSRHGLSSNKLPRNIFDIFISYCLRQQPNGRCFMDERIAI